jgi:hypothetical protein
MTDLNFFETAEISRVMNSRKHIARTSVEFYTYSFIAPGIQMKEHGGFTWTKIKVNLLGCSFSFVDHVFWLGHTRSSLSVNHIMCSLIIGLLQLLCDL